MLCSCAPAMQLGSDTVTASDHVRTLGVWPSRSMFRRPGQLDSTGCANVVASGDRSTRDRHQLLCTLL